MAYGPDTVLGRIESAAGSTTTTGRVAVRGAYNALVPKPGSLNASYVHANRNATLLAGTATSGNFGQPDAVGADASRAPPAGSRRHERAASS